MRISSFLLAGLLLATLPFFAQTVNLDSEAWTVTKEEKGMQIYFRNNVADNVVECKIVTELPVSSKEFVSYLFDAERLDEWAVPFAESHLLTSVSAAEYLLYGKVRSRMIEVNSDIILRFRLMPVKGGTVGYFQAEPGYLPEEPHLDRMELFEGRWGVMDLDANRCKFTYHLATDLGTSGIGDVIARKVFLQANTESVERLREHFDGMHAGGK